jgi:DNA-binding MarR family transcriptional regulator
VSATRKPTKQRLAAEVWRVMSSFTTDKIQSSSRLAIVRELGLSPGHFKALAVLDPDEPKPMRALADALMCDASMVTWLVDRLEERGLVDRGSSPTDRRVKTLILTPLGIETRTRIMAAMFEPPDALTALDMDSLLALREALMKLPAAKRPFFAGSAAPER